MKNFRNFFLYISLVIYDFDFKFYADSNGPIGFLLKWLFTNSMGYGKSTLPNLDITDRKKRDIQSLILNWRKRYFFIWMK